MDYNELIEQTKKALESYSKADTELEELYRQAKERNNKSYELSKNQLAEQYYEDKNQAASRAALSAKDMNEFLAARGLATSGESVQAKLDSNMALNSALSGLAKSNMQSLTELEKQRLEKESELDMSLAEKKLELNKQKNTLSDQIEQLKKALENSNKSTDDNKSNDNNKSTNSDKKNNNGTTDNNKTKDDTTEKPYVPSTSAKDIAKNILETFASGGKITTDLQRSQIKKYLQSLVKNDGVDEDYIKDIVFILKTYGYSDISEAYADSVIAAKDAAEYYNKMYNDYYEIYVRGNRTADKASSMAKSKAKTLMLDYIYERSRTIAAFESAAKQSGVTQAELEEYYQRLNNIMNNGEKITLGSKVK